MYYNSQGATLDSGQTLARKNSSNNLSNREIEVLKWAAIGKTSWEMSLILEITERTVNFHLSNSAEKMGVKGRCAACSAAIAQGIIDF